MKLALITPWENAWVPLFEKAAVARGYKFGVFKTAAPNDADVVIHGWASGSPCVPRAKNIVCLRRYELFDGGLAKVDWKMVHALVCCNTWIASTAKKALEEVNVPVHVIYNAVDTSKWTFANRTHGKKIGMACFIHGKKNLSLALQIMEHLPNDYELHIAGDIQDYALAEYLMHYATARAINVTFYGKLHSADMDKWWDDKNYCLSTSISEGNPNNVNEAMAKGIKPIVHAWPGAVDQYCDHVFYRVQDAADMMRTPSDYDSEGYLATVKEKFCEDNIAAIIDLANHPLEEAA